MERVTATERVMDVLDYKAWTLRAHVLERSGIGATQAHDALADLLARGEIERRTVPHLRKGSTGRPPLQYRWAKRAKVEAA